MGYDPFERGSRPVGVRSADLTDDARDRAVPVEIWYPADGVHAGEDLTEATQDRYRVLPNLPAATQEAVRDAAPGTGERHPLVVFSHGFGGHRRQTTHLCTHLASHGYVVASMDHTGNTMVDMMPMMLQAQQGGAPPDPAEVLGQFLDHRPRDASFVIDAVLDGRAGDLADLVDADRIGITGHSFGGWTTLQTTGRDPRIRAAMPLAPAGGASPLQTGPVQEALDLAWDREVPTLYLVAEHDTLLPLDGMHGMLERTRGSRSMVVLKNADHMHFCDRIDEIHEFFRLMTSMATSLPDMQALQGIRPIAELCPSEHAYLYLRGLGLAHMDAHLKGVGEAVELLEGDIAGLLGARGIEIEVF